MNVTSFNVYRAVLRLRQRWEQAAHYDLLYHLNMKENRCSSRAVEVCADITLSSAFFFSIT